MRCPKCGLPQPDDALACSNCGEPLPIDGSDSSSSYNPYSATPSSNDGVTSFSSSSINLNIGANSSESNNTSSFGSLSGGSIGGSDDNFYDPYSKSIDNGAPTADSLFGAQYSIHKNDSEKQSVNTEDSLFTNTTSSVETASSSFGIFDSYSASSSYGATSSYSGTSSSFGASNSYSSTSSSFGASNSYSSTSSSFGTSIGGTDDSYYNPYSKNIDDGTPTADSLFGAQYSIHKTEPATTKNDAVANSGSAFSDSVATGSFFSKLHEAEDNTSSNNNSSDNDNNNFNSVSSIINSNVSQDTTATGNSYDNSLNFNNESASGSIFDNNSNFNNASANNTSINVGAASPITDETTYAKINTINDNPYSLNSSVSNNAFDTSNSINNTPYGGNNFNPVPQAPAKSPVGLIVATLGILVAAVVLFYFVLGNGSPDGYYECTSNVYFGDANIPVSKLALDIDGEKIVFELTLNSNSKTKLEGTIKFKGNDATITISGESEKATYNPIRHTIEFEGMTFKKKHN